MREYIHHEVNGLLFKFRDPSDLAAQMKRLVLDPHLAAKIASGGYLSQRQTHPPISIRIQMKSSRFIKKL